MKRLLLALILLCPMGMVDDHQGDIFFRLYEMRKVRDAMPVDDPRYPAVERRYRALAEAAEKRSIRLMEEAAWNGKPL